jgi:hypothetical protein
LNEVPDNLPEFVARLDGNQMTISVDGEPMLIRRMPELLDDEIPELPDDADSQIPGP